MSGGRGLPGLRTGSAPIECCRGGVWSVSVSRFAPMCSPGRASSWTCSAGLPVSEVWLRPCVRRGGTPVFGTLRAAGRRWGRVRTTASAVASDAKAAGRERLRTLPRGWASRSVAPSAGSPVRRAAPREGPTSVGADRRGVLLRREGPPRWRRPDGARCSIWGCRLLRQVPARWASCSEGIAAGFGGRWSRRWRLLCGKARRDRCCSGGVRGFARQLVRFGGRVAGWASGSCGVTRYGGCCPGGSALLPLAGLRFGGCRPGEARCSGRRRRPRGGGPGGVDDRAFGGDVGSERGHGGWVICERGLRVCPRSAQR